MLNTNINEYRKMTAQEVWDEIDWNYGINADSIVYRLETDEYNVMVSVTNYDDPFPVGIECVCEVEDASNGDLIAQGFGGTAEQALLDAAVEMVGTDVLREEDNCEDAVNGIAYEAYQTIHGETPMFMMDVEEMDKLIALARTYVKRQGHFFGIEWEEF